MEDRELLLDVLNELYPKQYSTFLFHLMDPKLKPHLSRKEVENVSPLELVPLLENTYPDEALKITANIMEKIKRTDLCKKLKKGDDQAPGRGDAVLEEAALSHSPQRAQETTRADEVMEARVSSYSKQRGLANTLVTDAQLMCLARKVGKSWKQIGIEFLEIESHKLDQIEEENQHNAVLKTFNMLKAWKNQVKREATPSRLHELLSQHGVPLEPEAYEFLVD